MKYFRELDWMEKLVVVFITSVAVIGLILFVYNAFVIGIKDF